MKLCTFAIETALGAARRVGVDIPKEDAWDYIAGYLEVAGIGVLRNRFVKRS
jgi:hypothetical protein